MNKNASRVAFLFVLILVGSSVYWWARKRPAYVMMQIKSEEKRGNQLAVISHYNRLLKKENLTQEEELRLRKELATFYWDAGQIESTVFLQSWDDATYKVDRPFLGKAKDQFKKVLELDPHDSQARLYLGLMQLIEGKESFAIEELKASHESDPSSPYPLYYLARIQLDRGKHVEAKELSLEALAIDAEFDRARMVLVEVFGQTGQIEKAIQEFRKLSTGFRSLARNRAQFALYLAQNNEWRQSLSEIEKAIKDAEKNDFVRLHYGRILLEQDRLEEAYGELAYASSLNPRSPWPLIWQSQIFKREGRCEEAQRIARLLSDVLPRWSWTHLAKGHFFICEGSARKAISALDEADRLSPSFVSAAELKSQILIDKGQYKALGDTLRPLLDKQVSESFAYMRLAQSLFLQSKFDLSKEMAEIAIEKNIRNAWAYVWLGLAQFKLNQATEGARSFNKALEYRNQDPLIAGHFGLFKSLVGDFTRANDIFDRILKTYPEEPLLWNLHGQNLQLQRRHQEAIQAFKRALGIRPYLLNAHLSLIDLYWKEGEKDLAQTILRDVYKLNPQHPRVNEWKKKLN